MKKVCTKCGSTENKKNWKRQGKQRLLCKNCWYVWEHGQWKNRKKCKMNDLLDSYVRDDLKYRQIALNENITIQTVQRWLDKNEFKKIIVTM